MNPLYKKLGFVGLAAAGIGLLLKKDSSRETEESLRKKVVNAASSQIGASDPTPYWTNVTGQSQSSSLSWCGAFALWALHQAGLALDKNWILGKGFLLTTPTPLPTTKNPKPGDIAYYTTNQHQAVVAAVYPDGTMDLINGNGTGGKVSPSSHSPISKAAAIYSIQPYIGQKLG